MGFWLNLSQYVKESNDVKTLNTFQRASCGMTAGAMAAFIGNPADLALVRMQADATLPEGQRRHYRHVGDALTRIVKDEGIYAL